jgi:hypothetical protein
MFITGVESHKTIYILTDTPAHLIEREASYQANKWGYDYEEILEQLIVEMTYSDLDPAKRVKVYEIKADKERQQAILDRVDLCRKFIFDVLEKIKIMKKGILIITLIDIILWVLIWICIS